MLARSIRVAVVLMALAPVAGARAASIWTPVATGLPSSDTITAISWPSAGEVVLATGGGRILHGSITGLAAASVTPSNPTGFNDVAMSPDGTRGVAVGGSGQIYRSTDSGASWARLPGSPTEYSNAECSSSPSYTPPTLGPLTDDLLTVKFADNGTVYITGRHRDVLKSTDGGTTFTEVNKKADGTCVAAGMSGDFTGQQWIDSFHGYLIDNEFGQYYTTINGFASTTEQSDLSVNLGRARVAIDPGTPSHAWAISDGQSGAYFQSTTDNGGTWNTPNYDRNQLSFQDIAFGAGTVVAVGKQGDIYTSADGKGFNRQVADPPLNANDWQTVAMLDAAHALVGGAGGVLLATSQANAVPGAAVPGSGAAAPSASQPVTVTTGGAKIRMFRRVKVSGARKRFIPVTLSTRRRRRFLVAMQTGGRRPRTLASVNVTFGAGTRTVRVPVSSRVKLGNYRLLVRVFMPARRGRQVGRSVKQVFILA